MLGMISRWIYDKDPLEGVRFEQALAALKADLNEGKPVFQELLRKYIVSNQHRVTVEMVPDTELEASNLEKEADKMKHIKSKMSEKDIEDVIETTRQLKAAQEAEDTPEARATIPRLDITDINPDVKDIPINVEKKSDVGVVLRHDLETSGILYSDIAFEINVISSQFPSPYPLVKFITICYFPLLLSSYFLGFGCR
jgi:hypothetical protein